eukprot:EG_transcript_42891
MPRKEKEKAFRSGKSHETPESPRRSPRRTSSSNQIPIQDSPRRSPSARTWTTAFGEAADEGDAALPPPRVRRRLFGNDDEASSSSTLASPRLEAAASPSTSIADEPS